MRRIIADTNIWYEIEKAEVVKLYRNDFQIVVPIIVLNELYTSPKIHLSEISFSKLKKAINILLASIFDNLLRTASKVGNKFENNDWVDILILSYVGKNDLYWTNERSKLKAFKNLNYESQLFIPA